MSSIARRFLFLWWVGRAGQLTWLSVDRTSKERRFTVLSRARLDPCIYKLNDFVIAKKFKLAIASLLYIRHPLRSK